MLPRERFAWVWLTASVVIFGIYFTILSTQESEPDLPFLLKIGQLAAALLTLAVVVGIDRLIAYFRRERRAEFRLDERDRLIHLRASSVAYYVLMTGMIIVGCVMPFDQRPWEIVHAAIFAIVVAEVVHSGLVIIGYRKGVHD